MAYDSSLEAALAYVGMGWPVIGIRHAGKAPAYRHKNGKHDATVDSETVREWFSYGDDGVAIVTGPRSGLLVLDIDPRNGGDESFTRLEAEIGDLPPSITAITGGGGRHIYFQIPQWCSIEGDSANLAGFPGLDVKCGGYVVAAPSVHQSGQSYQWAKGKAPTEVALADLPLKLYSVISTAKGIRRQGGKGAKLPNLTSNGRVGEGGRNDALFRRGCALRAKGLSEAEIRGALIVLNSSICCPPLDEAEVCSIAKSVMRYDEADNFDQTDLGNARRFVRSNQGEIRFDPTSGQWYVWDGTHWRADGDGQVDRLLRACVDKMLEDSQIIDDPERARRGRAWALTSQSAAKLAAAEQLARAEPGVPVMPSCLDTNRYALNVANGTIDLKSGELRPHCKDDLITRLIPIEYDPNASCPTWSSFIDQITNHDQELAQYLQLVCGYAATGDVSEQCLFLLYGSGANGKSTFLNTVRAVLSEYARQTPTETLLANGARSSTGNDLARLRGARFVTASEVDDGRRMAEALVKQLTGGEPITARFLFREHFEFVPELKLFLATNHLPELSGGDPAIWRRIRQIPFAVAVPPENQDRSLPAKLAAEHSGILKWIVDGAQRWASSGLTMPSQVATATEAYRRDMDIVGTFLNDRCELGSQWKTPAIQLHAAFKLWAFSEGREALNAHQFGGQLTKRGIAAVKQGTIFRKGVRLVNAGQKAC